MIPRNTANALFILYLIAFAACTILFFAIGYSAVSMRSWQDLAGIKSTPLHQYAYNPQTFSEITMTPIFIITSFELYLWVMLATFGVFKRQSAMMETLTLYFMLMGMTIWYYSLL